MENNKNPTHSIHPLDATIGVPSWQMIRTSRWEVVHAAFLSFSIFYTKKKNTTPSNFKLM